MNYSGHLGFITSAGGKYAMLNTKFMDSQTDVQKEKLQIGVEARLGIFLIILFLALAGLDKIFHLYRLPTLKGSDTTVAYTGTHATSSIEITHGNIAKKQVTFTFDGGDGTQSADEILAALASHHVKGTFFLTGKFILRNSELVKKIAKEGHEIFNHTYDHPYLTQLPAKDVAEELRRNERILKLVTGTSPQPYFRAPYGDRDQRVLKAAFSAGYQSVYWTVDAGDWQESNGETAEQVRNNVISNLAPGNIYLMHIGDTLTGKLIDGIFSDIESKGYKIVSLTQGL